MERKIECKFCHEAYYDGKVGMCPKCFDAQIRRRDMIQNEEDMTTLHYAILRLNQHMSTVNSEVGPEWYEKKRILQANVRRLSE